MSRAKSYDPGQALDAAMRLFWRKGYHATSIQDLVEATGLNRSSLYGAFGGKEDLFLAAVERYLKEVNRKRLARLQAEGSAKAALKVYFEDLVRFATGDGKQLGCLLTNSAIEFCAEQEDLGKRIYGIFSDVEEVFAGLIRRAQAAGEISPDKDPQAAARFLVTLINGLRVMSRVRQDEEWIRDAVSGVDLLFQDQPKLHLQ